MSKLPGAQLSLSLARCLKTSPTTPQLSGDRQDDIFSGEVWPPTTLLLCVCVCFFLGSNSLLCGYLKTSLHLYFLDYELSSLRWHFRQGILDFFFGDCILVLVWINPLLFRSPICKIRIVYCSNSLLSVFLHLYFSDLQTFNSPVTFPARYTSPCSSTKIMWCQTYTNIGTYIYCRANLNSRIIGCFNCCCCYWPTAAPIACLSWYYGLEMGLKQSLLIQDLLLEVRTHLAGNLILVS